MPWFAYVAGGWALLIIVLLVLWSRWRVHEKQLEDFAQEWVEAQRRDAKWN